VAKSFNNLGNIYMCLGQDEQALEYQQKGLDITVRLDGERAPTRSHEQVQYS
jgi:hypothetical protein